MHSCADGGRRAHSYAKALDEELPQPVHEGLPIVGKQAVEALVAEWKPRWTDPSRLQESQGVLETSVTSTLERSTVHRLDKVLATYPERVGLGNDCLHPRSFLLLPRSSRQRLIDIMHTWERSPKRPLDWVNVIVFLTKLTGGLRPIGLAVSVMRVWSRIRSEEAGDWEAQHDAGFFWGAKGKTCDMAGWCHNILAGFARHAGFEVATLFGDIEKFL
jgi:hypothetical protein